MFATEISNGDGVGSLPVAPAIPIAYSPPAVESGYER
jgi:hypothetical protein